jgi:hypothetical protein
MTGTGPRRRGSAEPEPAQSITCPYCGKQISLDEALRHQLAADAIRHKEAELRLLAEKAATEKVQGELDRQREELTARDERLAELTGKLREQQNAEKELLRRQRELEDQKDAWEVERERMRNQIRVQEREQARKAQQELFDQLARRKDDDHRTEVRRLTDQIERMKAQLEQAARRGAAGSRQEEGLARQEVFADQLRQRFPDDDVVVTPRGKAGADVTQRVRLGGREFGVIIWECKRTATWNAAWPNKLAADMRTARAGLAVIVSEVLPAGMDGSGRIGEVWVCDFASAPHLAAGIRLVLIAAAQYEAANAARADTAEKVYDYIATGGFAARCEAVSRTVEEMMATLARERRYYELRWKDWERHLGTVVAGLSGIAGDLVGLGAELPPPLRAELPEARIRALPGGPAQPTPA